MQVPQKILKGFGNSDRDLAWLLTFFIYSTVIFLRRNGNLNIKWGNFFWHIAFQVILSLHPNTARKPWWNRNIRVSHRKKKEIFRVIFKIDKFGRKPLEKREDISYFIAITKICFISSSCWKIAKNWFFFNWNWKKNENLNKYPNSHYYYYYYLFIYIVEKWFFFQLKLIFFYISMIRWNQPKRMFCFNKV